jgi:hypothetical protein
LSIHGNWCSNVCIELSSILATLTFKESYIHIHRYAHAVVPPSVEYFWAVCFLRNQTFSLVSILIWYESSEEWMVRTWLQIPYLLWFYLLISRIDVIISNDLINYFNSFNGVDGFNIWVTLEACSFFYVENIEVWNKADQQRHMTIHRSAELRKM